jgi:hypothetical protein
MTTHEIESRIVEFERQFWTPRIPPGTPNRRQLQRIADQEARDAACEPEVIAERLALLIALRRARRSEAARAAWQARRADPRTAIRQLVFHHLRGMGFKREHTSGSSAYYRRGLLTVRVSDHEVPMTDERAYNRENGGKSWADSSWSFVIDRDTSRMAALRWLVEIRREVRQS